VANSQLQFASGAQQLQEAIGMLQEASELSARHYGTAHPGAALPACLPACLPGPLAADAPRPLLLLPPRRRVALSTGVNPSQTTCAPAHQPCTPTTLHAHSASGTAGPPSWLRQRRSARVAWPAACGLRRGLDWTDSGAPPPPSSSSPAFAGQLAVLLDYLQALQALPEGQEQQRRLHAAAESLLQVASAVCGRYQAQEDGLSGALLLEAVLAELAPVLPRDLPSLVGTPRSWQAQAQAQAVLGCFGPEAQLACPGRPSMPLAWSSRRVAAGGPAMLDMCAWHGAGRAWARVSEHADASALPWLSRRRSWGSRRGSCAPRWTRQRCGCWRRGAPGCRPSCAR
jgi:hypothetical protein